MSVNSFRNVSAKFSPLAKDVANIFDICFFDKFAKFHGGRTLGTFAALTLVVRFWSSERAGSLPSCASGLSGRYGDFLRGDGKLTRENTPELVFLGIFQMDVFSRPNFT